MSNNRNERANKNQGRHEGNSSRSDNTRESSQQTTMNDKNRMPKPVETANARKENQAANASKPKPAPEQTGEKEGRDSSSKDTDHGRPEARNKQEQAGHVDRDHDGPSHDDKPSQPNKSAAKDAPVPVEKPSQPSVASLPKPRKAKNHDSFYLGLASAVLVAALGLSLSTMPIFFSLPLAAVLFGIGIWLLAAFALIYHHNPLQSKPKDSAANDKHEGK